MSLARSTRICLWEKTFTPRSCHRWSSFFLDGFPERDGTFWWVSACWILPVRGIEKRSLSSHVSPMPRYMKITRADPTRGILRGSTTTQTAEKGVMDGLPRASEEVEIGSEMWCYPDGTRHSLSLVMVRQKVVFPGPKSRSSLSVLRIRYSSMHSFI